MLWLNYHTFLCLWKQKSFLDFWTIFCDFVQRNLLTLLGIERSRTLMEGIDSKCLKLKLCMTTEVLHRYISNFRKWLLLLGIDID
jgi:hypothetical protein